MQVSRLLPNEAANILTVQIRLNVNDLTRAGNRAWVGGGCQEIQSCPDPAGLLFRMFEQVSDVAESERLCHLF